MLSKITEIVLAHIAMVRPTPQQKDVAEKRAEICLSCEFLTNFPFKHSCNLCRCDISAKVYSKKGIEACPQKKWTI